MKAQKTKIERQAKMSRIFIESIKKIEKKILDKRLKNLLGVICLSYVMTGCTNVQSSPMTLKSAVPQAAKPVVMPTYPNKADYRLAYGNSPALLRAYQQYLHTGKALNIVTEGFEQFAYGASQPVIAASPLALTVISLEAGENVTNVSSGDPLRWSYSMAYSGQGKLRQAHIMVKPSVAHISTDLVIATDKRLYTLKLVSNEDKYLKDVRFWYPEEIQSFWDNYNAKQSQDSQTPDVAAALPNIALEKMNFDYAIEAPFLKSPAWKPIRVFDDGVHTYIQFPAQISSQELPALFVESRHQQALVNYRAKPPYFVVDKLFEKALLVSGVGSAKASVTIVNRHYR